MERVDHAVVIGGSLAGLLAARVLADAADHVTVLDADELPATATFRRGVPQSTHSHALLPGGVRVVEALLPGFSDDLRHAGAPELDISADLAWSLAAGWGVRFESHDLRFFTCTRELLEWTVRRRVAAMPNVEVRSGARVTGLRDVDAGIVVDATGRASRAPKWLEEIGLDAPPETLVDANLAYASQVIDAPLDAIPGARGAYVQSAPPAEPRGGVALPLENGRWLVTLVGSGGDHPPRDQRGFEAFAASLREPVIARLLETGTPAASITTFGATSNRFRHYERVAMPDGFIVVGDAACAFNPVYAQGMSAAAMTAAALQQSIRRSPTPAALSRRFPKALAKAVKIPWMLATAADFEVAGVRPSRPTALMNRYVRRVMSASTQSAAARRPLLEVMTLLKPPPALFAPSVIAAAVRHRPATVGAETRELVHA